MPSPELAGSFAPASPAAALRKASHPYRPLDSAVLLVNRSARRAGAAGWVEPARAELARRFDVEVCHPRDAGESLALARAASAAGRVVAVGGGDGTVGLVAHALADTGGTLGILPLGTANDLARELGVPRLVRAAARLMAGGTVRRTDLVSVNGRRFTTVGGLGLVSSSTTDVARLRASRIAAPARMLGAGVYKLAAAGGLFKRRISGGMRVTWHDASDGSEHQQELDVHGVFVTNHATCGGGLTIPTGARADDGLFEIALIPATSRPRLLVNLARLSAGLPLEPGVLVVLRTDRAVIETEHEDTFVADGDALERGRHFALESLRGAIGILR